MKIDFTNTSYNKHFTNTLNNISAAAGTPHLLNIDLNEHALTVVENIDFNTISVNLTDFGNEMFRFKSNDEEALILSHITAWHNDVLLEDIVIKTDGEYKYLFSDSLVPVPAFFAALLGLAVYGALCKDCEGIGCDEIEECNFIKG